MHADYLNRLPIQVQALIEQLESFANLEIGVEVDTTKSPPTEANPDRLAARITEREATILVRNEHFESQGVLHELLHIRRFWVDAVPQIIPLDSAPENNWQFTAQIENALEHLIIVPQEADFGFEPFAYWNETARRNFARYPWSEMRDPWTRRANCLLTSLCARFLVTDPEVTALVRAALDQEGILKPAWEFAKRVHDRRHDKQKMLMLVLQHLGIPRTDVKLIALDVRKRQTWQLAF